MLAHGYASNMHCWNIVADELVVCCYKVLAFNQHGHGRSTISANGIGSRQMVDNYLTVLRKYNMRNGVLVGHSMGGFIAICVLIEKSAAMAIHIGGCLLMSTSAGDVNCNRIQIPLIKSGIMSQLIHNHSVAVFFAKPLLGDVKDKGMMNAFVDVFRKTDVKLLVPILIAFVVEDQYAQLSNVSLPCTVIVGTKDKTSLMFYAEHLHKGITNSKVVHVETMGNCCKPFAQPRGSTTRKECAVFT
jgi:non-heme chloroperoxidase